MKTSVSLFKKIIQKILVELSERAIKKCIPRRLATPPTTSRIPYTRPSLNMPRDFSATSWLVRRQCAQGLWSLYVMGCDYRCLFEINTQRVLDEMSPVRSLHSPSLASSPGRYSSLDHWHPCLLSQCSALSTTIASKPDCKTT